MSITKVKTSMFGSGWGYQLDFHRRGLKRVRKNFETRALAQAVLDKLSGDAVKRQYGIPVGSGVKLGALIDKHLERSRARGRQKTKWVENVLLRFRGLVGKDRLVERIKTADLDRYVECRLAAGRVPKPQTINREMVEIKSCLTAAKTYFSTLEGWQSPRAPWQQEPDDGRRQTWTPENTQAVLAELYAPMREKEQKWQHRSRVAVGDMFYIARRVGLRAGEARTLRKANVDFNSCVMTIRSRKGVSKRRQGKTRLVPMPEDVAAILQGRIETATGEWLFPNRAGDGPMTDHLTAFITACERAGISYGMGKEGALIFNDARRSAENEMLDAGHSPRAVGDLFGHSAETMAKHYARSTDGQRRAAVEATSWTVHTVSTQASDLVESGDLEKEEEKAKGARGK